MREELALTSVSPVCSFCLSESRRPAASKDTESQQDLDDLTVLKSLADGHKPKEATEVPHKSEDQYVPDESDSTKSRRLAEDYDSTKNGMDYGKYQGMHACNRAPCSHNPFPVCQGAVLQSFLLRDLWPLRQRQASRRLLLSVTGRPAGGHFEEEEAGETRACDGDKQRQIERVRDTCSPVRKIILVLSDTAAVKARRLTGGWIFLMNTNRHHLIAISYNNKEKYQTFLTDPAQEIMLKDTSPRSFADIGIDF